MAGLINRISCLTYIKKKNPRGHFQVVGFLSSCGVNMQNSTKINSILKGETPERIIIYTRPSERILTFIIEIKKTDKVFSRPNLIVDCITKDSHRNTSRRSKTFVSPYHVNFWSRVYALQTRLTQISIYILQNMSSLSILKLSK